ncbi:hypothetical protein ABW21_db0203822 [Orbilia brochopaga]|nr:hypothetical protein ABW21_db0203822 [Drechslerella brochopaga]
MEQHRLRAPTQRPRLVYRVHYPRAATKYSKEGFIAGNENALPPGPEELIRFYRVIDAHLRWRSPILSPLISVTSDKDAAERWAEKWQLDHPNLSGSVFVMTIRPSADEVMFSMAEILASRGRYDEADLHQTEYLIYKRIPDETIIGVRRLKEFELPESQDPTSQDHDPDHMLIYDPNLSYSSDEDLATESDPDTMII